MLFSNYRLWSLFLPYRNSFFGLIYGLYASSYLLWGIMYNRLSRREKKLALKEQLKASEQDGSGLSNGNMNSSSAIVKCNENPDQETTIWRDYYVKFQYNCQSRMCVLHQSNIMLVKCTFMPPVHLLIRVLDTVCELIYFLQLHLHFQIFPGSNTFICIIYTFKEQHSSSIQSNNYKLESNIL